MVHGLAAAPVRRQRDPDRLRGGDVGSHRGDPVVRPALRAHAPVPQLSSVVGWVTLAWLVVRWADLLNRGVVGLAFAGDVKATMFWIENALFVGAALVFLTPAGRASQRASFVAAVALFAGAYLPARRTHDRRTPSETGVYFPSRSRADGHGRHHLARDPALSRLHQVVPGAGRREPSPIRPTPDRRLRDPHHDRSHHPHRGASAHRL